MTFSKFSILATLAAPAMVAAAPVGGDLALVQQHLQGVQTMTAGFSQTDRTGKTVTGTLTLKQPGKIRFQYQKGVPLLIVGDGKALTMIDYQVKQVQRWPIGNSPLAVLLDPTGSVARRQGGARRRRSRIVVGRGARSQAPRIWHASPWSLCATPSAPAGLMLQGWVALDSQNNRTTIRLSQPALQRRGQRRHVPLERSAPNKDRAADSVSFILATGSRP